MRRLIFLAGADGSLNKQAKEKTMKRNNKVTTLPPAAPSADGGESTAKQSNAKQSNAENGALEVLVVIHQHQIRMSRGELIFYLRDVHRYWSTPRISYHEIEELEQQNLIERSPNGICAIRLTEQGARIKNCQQLKAP